MASSRFCVSLQEHKLSFIWAVAMYLIFLCGKAERHVIGCDARLQNAALIEDNFPNSLWSLLTLIWPSV